MSREKLIKKLKEKNPKLNRPELEGLLNIFENCIKDSLKKGQEVEIRDFGSFRLSKLKSNPNLRNPRTNELIYRPARIKLRFKASKKLNKIINE